MPQFQRRVPTRTRWNTSGRWHEPPTSSRCLHQSPPNHRLASRCSQSATAGWCVWPDRWTRWRISYCRQLRRACTVPYIDRRLSVRRGSGCQERFQNVPAASDGCYCDLRPNRRTLSWEEILLLMETFWCTELPPDDRPRVVSSDRKQHQTCNGD